MAPYPFAMAASNNIRSQRFASGKASLLINRIQGASPKAERKLLPPANPRFASQVNGLNENPLHFAHGSQRRELALNHVNTRWVLSSLPLSRHHTL